MLMFFIILITFSLFFFSSSKETDENHSTGKTIFSIVLDFIPIIGNFKCIGEAIIGKDVITGEELSKIERIISFIGVIPFGNYFKNGKHLKNGQKFMKAALRGKKLGKISNAVNFLKASNRAYKKANAFPKLLGGIVKTTKNVFKLFG